MRHSTPQKTKYFLWIKIKLQDSELHLWESNEDTDPQHYENLDGLCKRTLKKKKKVKEYRKNGKFPDLGGLSEWLCPQQSGQGQICLVGRQYLGLTLYHLIKSSVWQTNKKQTILLNILLSLRLIKKKMSSSFIHWMFSCAYTVIDVFAKYLRRLWDLSGEAKQSLIFMKLVSNEGEEKLQSFINPLKEKSMMLWECLTGRTNV